MPNENFTKSKIPELGDFVLQDDDARIFEIIKSGRHNIRLISSDKSEKSIREIAFYWEWHPDLTCWFIKIKSQPANDIDRKFREDESGTPGPGLLGSNNGVTSRKPGVYEGSGSSTGGLNNKAGLQHPQRAWGNW